MTEIHGTNYGTVPESSPVYAFNTDSARGLALAVDLLDKGVNVYRGVQPFTAGGKQFYTGAALVDRDSLAAAPAGTLAALAAARQTPVTGLPGFPVQHRQLSVPKIGLYTGTASVPSNPLFPQGGTRYCGQNSFCEALHDLGVKLNLPIARIVPVTSDDLLADKLSTENFTAFINAGSNIAVTTGTPPVLTPTGTNLQKFILNGGNYIGVNNNGASAARGVNATKLNTTSTTQLPELANLITPGSTFDATFDTSNPVAWGFDLGGWIYRDASGNSVFDNTTLDTATAVVRYGNTPDEKYGYETRGDLLNGRPAVVDSPSGQGHAVMIGFNPFYRSWKEQDERLVLNAALYPKGPALEPSAPTEKTAAPAAAAPDIKAATVAPGEPTKAGRVAVRESPSTDRNLKIQVKRADGAKLKAAVKAANLSKSIKRKLKYTTTKSTVTLTIKGVRTSDEHARKAWVSRLKNGLDRRKVTPLYALV
jgi:hypothetical protein